MLWFLCSIFTVLLIESAIFSWVGHNFGLWTTGVGIIFTAIIGVAIIRRKGLVTLALLQKKLMAGQFSTLEFMQGLWVFIVGLLFILPGFFSDFLALLFSINYFRNLSSIKLLQAIFQKKTFNTEQYSDTANTIDGEFHEINDPKQGS